MPIVFRVDHEQRVIVAVGHGAVTEADVFGHQRNVASLPGTAGFHQLIDMTRVTEIVSPNVDRVRELAALAAGSDRPGPRARIAIVALSEAVFGLGRMYQSYRELRPESMKEVGVFRTMEEALAFLGLGRLPALPEVP